MSDEALPMSRDEQADHAQRLLTDPVLVHAFYEIHENAVTTWKNSDSPGQREQQWHMIRAIRELQRVLEGKLTDVKMEERRIRLRRSMQPGVA
jgi:hypothetical protein